MWVIVFPGKGTAQENLLICLSQYWPPPRLLKIKAYNGICSPGTFYHEGDEASFSTDTCHEEGECLQMMQRHKA